MIHKLITTILFLSTFLTASTDILKTSQVFIDESSSYTIDNIHKAKFEKSNTSKIRLGYTDSTAWVKFKLSNNSTKTINKVIVLDNQMLDHITLFTKKQNGYLEDTTGILNEKYIDSKILSFDFSINLKPNESKEFYLKASSLSCAVYFHLNLMDKDEFYQKDKTHQLILAVFFGAISVLILYNLFIFFFTKDLAYLYYILYLFFTGWNHISYSGMGLYIVPKWFVELDAFLAILYLSCGTIFGLLFTREFLGVKKYKKIDFGIKVLITISVLFILFTSKEFYPLDIVVRIFLLSFIYLISFSFYLLYKGEPNAKYIVVGWSVAIFGWIMLATLQYGYFSLIEIYPYFYEFTILFEAVLFSVALASKVNKTKELENSLDTSKVLSRELHHRVKNNMQFIISLYRLKLNDRIDTKVDEKLKEVENSIKAMSNIHEILYDRNDLLNIDAKEYFTTLIDELKSTYKNNDIKITLNSNATIDINKAIYCGLVLNELVTNAFKYAFTDGVGNIDINIVKQNDKTILIIEDNGSGFDSSQDASGFGIELVNSLVENELDGKIDTIKLDGVKYIIEF
ncbi:MAG: hypothetical protein DRG78_05280 [Epsilonproteobacteria bacterium]|nr:MAG: hypothetical protein DRG78_05280 [Campylobacterota bacterium]